MGRFTTVYNKKCLLYLLQANQQAPLKKSDADSVLISADKDIQPDVPSNPDEPALRQ